MIDPTFLFIEAREDKSQRHLMNRLMMFVALVGALPHKEEEAIVRDALHHLPYIFNSA